MIARMVREEWSYIGVRPMLRTRYADSLGTSESSVGVAFQSSLGNALMELSPV